MADRLAYTCLCEDFSRAGNGLGMLCVCSVQAFHDEGSKMVSIVLEFCLGVRWADTRTTVTAAVFFRAVFAD